MSMTVEADAETGSSLARRAYLELRDRLVMLDIRPGEPINDDAIAAELGVGRTPVREALKRLETERLVVSYPRRGTFASGVDITDLGQISEVRVQLEPLAASLAAARATAAQRDEMRSLAGGFGRASSDERAMMRYDVRVHRAIYAATANPYLEDTLIRYDNLATRIWCLFTARLPGLAGHVGEHRELVAAVVAGDEGNAARLARAHVSAFEQAIRAVV